MRNLLAFALKYMHNLNIDITYGPAKNERNIAERGLSFALVAQFDFASASIYEDTRNDYAEVRYIAIGRIAQRLHVVVFSETKTGLRVISLRKANQREVLAYEQP